MRWPIAALLLGLGCAGQPGATVVVHGVSAWFPAAPVVKDAREPLRATARIAHAYDEDGARFEIARFVTDRRLDEEERMALLQKTVRSLLSLPGAQRHRVSPLRPGDPHAAIVEISFDDGRRGRWRLEIVDDRTFWQMSVVGPDEPSIWRRAERFFASLQRSP